jgi:hypothetical protein
VPAVRLSAEEAAGHFGWLGFFAALDRPASSQRTRQFLAWQPEQVGLLADLERGTDFDSPTERATAA